MDQHEIIYKDRELVVEGEYESPEFYINHVINIAGIDVTDKFKAEDFKNMQEIVLTKYDDNDGK